MNRLIERFLALPRNHRILISAANCLMILLIIGIVVFAKEPAPPAESPVSGSGSMTHVTGPELVDHCSLCP